MCRFFVSKSCGLREEKTWSSCPDTPKCKPARKENVYDGTNGNGYQPIGPSNVDAGKR